MTDSTKPTNVWDPHTRSWVDSSEVTSPLPAAKGRRGSRLGLLVLLLALVGVVALAARLVLSDSSQEARAQRTPTPTLNPRAAASFDASKLAEKAAASVVTVAVDAPTSAFGSGVVLDRSGYIATSASTIGQATRVRVRPASGGFINAKVVGTDVLTDVAILKVDAINAEPIIPDSAELVRAGDQMAVVGALPATDIFMATGHVASIGRPVDAPNKVVRFNQIQLDIASALAPTGGLALVSGGGPVGMSVSTLESGAAQIVPMDIVLRVRDELRKGASVTHPWTGIVTGIGLTANRDAQTLTVLLVTPGSPASEATVVAGDVISAIDGQPIRGPGTLMAKVASHQVGDEIVLTINRNNKQTEAKLKLSSQPQTF